MQGCFSIQRLINVIHNDKKISQRKISFKKILSKLEISSEFDKENLKANKKLIANILFNDERLKTFCFEDQEKGKNVCSHAATHVIWQSKQLKGRKNWK